MTIWTFWKNINFKYKTAVATFGDVEIFLYFMY